MKTKRLVFKGNEISRNAFLDNFIAENVNFFGVDINHSFLLLLVEIAKNIYDHANGKGELVFLMDGDEVDFVIRDYGTKKYWLFWVKLFGSTKSGNGINFGKGLSGGMIERCAKDLGIDLKIDTTSGFCYSGKYKFR